MKVGSLFSGYGGLDLAVEAAFGAEPAWFVEFDDAPSRILAHHWPHVPNLGDVTAIDWTQVEPVDVLTGGFPCQDVSAAGRRAGMADGTRSGLWSHMAAAIDALRPRWVVIENVRGLLSARAHRPMESEPDAVGDRDAIPVLRALGAVLGDLADLGYDAQWCTVAAAEVGACHQRQRVFILAHPADAARDGRDEGRPESTRLVGRPNAAVGGVSPGRGVDLLPTPTVGNATGTNERRGGARGDEMLLPGVAVAASTGGLLPTPRSRDHKGATASRAGDGHDLPSALLPTPAAADGNGGGRMGSEGHAMPLPGAVVQLLPTPEAKLANSGPDYARADRDGSGGDDLITAAARAERAATWGKYAPAIARAERAVGRPAPSPTEPNRNNKPRLNAAFAEWMMMLPAGWVTDPAIWNDSREVVEKIRAGFMPATARNQQLKAIGNGVCPPQAYAAILRLIEIARTA
ncbi:DNA methyltransferase [Gordonia phage Stultus]|uniref:DNA (cytosine-5-)-methyltransferase n=1 Tax=Gordonia phage Stultus TaxID=2483674 RepID=A0A3G3MC07_9CAUD|nr:DNA methyltransferase [Gordonia phage Stultus]AYR03474.1 DNA methylase [Gordonia phage Stultus]